MHRDEPCGNHYNLLSHQFLRGGAAPSKEDSIPPQASYLSLTRSGGRNRERMQLQCRSQCPSPDFRLLNCLLVYFLFFTGQCLEGILEENPFSLSVICDLIRICVFFRSALLNLSESLWTTCFRCHHGKL